MGVVFERQMYDAEGNGKIVGIDEFMGDPEEGQDENEQYGWEVVHRGTGRGVYVDAKKALMRAIAYAQWCKKGIYLSPEFVSSFELEDE